MRRNAHNPGAAWAAVREFALSLPNATEDFPWGESVIKVEKRDGPPPEWRRRKNLVHGPMFVWLGAAGAESPAVALKLKASYEEAINEASAFPTSHSGLGQWGWLTVPLDAVAVELVCDWVEESYRRVAPKKLIALLDAR